MAYFVAHHRGPGHLVAELDSLTQALAGRMGGDVLTEVGTETGGARSWRRNGPLGDIRAEDAASGSWLLVVGVPLVPTHYRTDAGRRELLREVLANPDRCVRAVLDGCHALLAYDGENDILFAATDFNRTVPIFWTVVDGGILLASSELALARTLRAEIDPAGFAQAVHLGTTWGDVTRFAGLSKLQPTELLSFRGGTVSRRRYWRADEECEWDGGFDAVLERWNDHLAAAVESYYAGNEEQPLHTDFTAGEDARLILARCHASHIPFEAHVAGFPTDKDVVITTRAAEKLGFPLHVIPQRIIDSEVLAREAQNIAVESDGYENYFRRACASRGPGAYRGRT